MAILAYQCAPMFLRAKCVTTTDIPSFYPLYRLLAASEAYQHVLSKKKKTDAFTDAEKLPPIDTLGIVMILHGEEFGEDSAFGEGAFLSPLSC